MTKNHPADAPASRLFKISGRILAALGGVSHGVAITNFIAADPFWIMTALLGTGLFATGIIAGRVVPAWQERHRQSNIDPEAYGNPASNRKWQAAYRYAADQELLWNSGYVVGGAMLVSAIINLIAYGMVSAVFLLGSTGVALLAASAYGIHNMKRHIRSLGFGIR